MRLSTMQSTGEEGPLTYLVGREPLHVQIRQRFKLHQVLVLELGFHGGEVVMRLASCRCINVSECNYCGESTYEKWQRVENAVHSFLVVARILVESSECRPPPLVNNNQ